MIKDETLHQNKRWVCEKTLYGNEGVLLLCAKKGFLYFFFVFGKMGYCWRKLEGLKSESRKECGSAKRECVRGKKNE